MWAGIRHSVLARSCDTAEVGGVRPQGWFAGPSGKPYVPRPRRSAQWIAAITGVCAAVDLVVVLVLAISERPIGGLRFALFPAVPVLVVGQVWTIIVLRRRASAFFPRRPPFGESTRWFFSPLPRRAIVSLLALFVAGWLCAASAFPFLVSGAPQATGNPACPYSADNHGSVTCVSKTAYLRAEAAEERLAAGVLLVFFTMHFGVAWSEVLRGRQADTGLS
jgi:hypothetical protein